MILLPAITNPSTEIRRMARMRASDSFACLLLSTVLSILDEQNDELCTVITYEEAFGLCGLQEAVNET